jgi:hypothetical protein
VAVQLPHQVPHAEWDLAVSLLVQSARV